MSQDAAGAGEELERMAQGLQQQAQRYTQLHEQLGATSVTERSQGGEVTVTVDANGVLTDLNLTERTRGMEPAELSAQVMSCTRRAQARLREQVRDMVAETVGDDGPGNNIVAQYAQRFPDPVAEESANAQDGGELAIGRLDDEQGGLDREPRGRARRQQDDDRDDDGWDGSAGSILR